MSLTRWLSNLFSGCRKKARVLMVGLDNSGKTTILYKLVTEGQLVETVTTIGFNTETVICENRAFEIWDFGGVKKIRWLWYRYCHDVHALILVVDCADRNRIAEVQELLTRLIKTPELRDAAILIYANKRDQVGAMSVNEVTKELRLNDLKNRKWHITPVCAIDSHSFQQLFNGLIWLKNNASV